MCLGARFHLIPVVCHPASEKPLAQMEQTRNINPNRRRVKDIIPLCDFRSTDTGEHPTSARGESRSRRTSPASIPVQCDVRLRFDVKRSRHQCAKGLLTLCGHSARDSFFARRCGIPTIRELLCDRVNTTIICTHVLNKGIMVFCAQSMSSD
jgi:hypothetical protein